MHSDRTCSFFFLFSQVEDDWNATLARELAKQMEKQQYTVEALEKGLSAVSSETGGESVVVAA